MTVVGGGGDGAVDIMTLVGGGGDGDVEIMQLISLQQPLRKAPTIETVTNLRIETTKSIQK